MIYKFLGNTMLNAKIGYIREIPESSIFYKAGEDNYGEWWYVGIPSNEFTNPLDIDWKGKNCSYVKTIKLGEYTFLYFCGIKAYHWPDVGKEEWDDKFIPFFNTLYIYEKRVDKINFDPYSSFYLTPYNPVSTQIDYEETWERIYENEKLKKLLEENSRICASYKIKELLPEGDLKVVKIWRSDEEDYGGITITRIDGEYKRHLVSYSNKDNQFELSTDGDEFWKQYDEYIEVIASH